MFRFDWCVIHLHFPYLDRVEKQGDVKAEAIVAATQKLGGDLQGVERMVKLIRGERVDPKFVESILRGGKWLLPLTSGEYLYFLKAIAGRDLSNTAAVIQSLWMWLHLKKPLEGKLTDFAWDCLETSNVEHQDYFSFDQIALHLAQTNTEKGFETLEKLLVKKLTD